MIKWLRTLVTFLILLAPLMSGLLASNALAQEAVTVIPVEVQNPEGFNRLIFKWDDHLEKGRLPKYTAITENNVLLIKFDRTYTVDLEEMLLESKSFIALARQDNDNKTLRLAMKYPVDISTGESEAHIYINIVPSNSGVAPAAYEAPRPLIDLDRLIVLAEKREVPSVEELRKLASVARPLPLNADRLPVRVIRNDTRSRIVFQWSDRVGYDIIREGDKIIINFNQVARPKLTRLRIDPPRFIKTADAVQRYGALEVTIDVDHETSFHHFRMDDDIVLDVTSKAPDLVAQAFKSMTKSEHEEEAHSAEALTDEEREPATKKDAVSEPHHAGSHGEEHSENVETVEVIDQAPSHLTSEHGGEPAELAEVSSVQQSLPKISKTVRVAMIETNEGVEINFPWGSDVAASIFKRGDYLWAIFDAKAKLDLSEFDEGRYFSINKVEELDLAEGTFVRWEVGPRALLTVRPEHHGWRILLEETAFGNTKSLKLVSDLSVEGYAKVTVDLPSVNMVHEVLDPEIGDSVFVVTALGPAQGLISSRRFVDFTAMASAHGMAIQPIAEDLGVNLDDGVVTITKPGGLAITGASAKQNFKLISKASDTKSHKKSEEEHASTIPSRKGGSGFEATEEVGVKYAGLEPKDRNPIVEFEAWKGNPKEGYYKTLADLNQSLGRAPKRTSSKRRLDLARFYFAHGLLSEALGAMEMIAVEEPGFTNEAAFVSLKGATQERMGRHKMALKTLTHHVVKDDPGAYMWRGMALENLANHKQARDAFAKGMGEIDRYPPLWRSRFQIAETKAALGVNDLQDANVMWDNIPLTHLEEDDLAEAQLIKGRILRAIGEPALALEYFRKVYPLTDGEMAHRARYNEIEMLYEVGEITPAKAIDRLEQLRYQWRGDDLELKAIRSLGKIYMDQKQYRDALSVLHVGVTFNPQHKIAREMRNQMDDVFEQLYLDGLANEMKPVDAISLYYDFKQLTPIGTKGDRMIRLLSERLVSIGLLDQAAELLTHQVNYRVKGMARAQVAMRLALIQLKNKKPNDAFKAISSTRFAGLPPKLRNQRRLIEARALADMGRHDHAIELLEDDISTEAEFLRANIFWDADNWPATGRVYEEILDDAWGERVALSEGQRSHVMRMAIAYALDDDQKSLNRIRQKFGEQMNKSVDARGFEIATGDMAIQGVAFRDVLRKVNSIDTFEAFMSDFKTRFGDDGTMVN
jgi:tetratricopeptide (TPR) repeat protein